LAYQIWQDNRGRAQVLNLNPSRPLSQQEAPQPLYTAAEGRRGPATQQYYLAQYGGAAVASTEVAIAAGATGGAAGSVAGQVVANVAGIQHGFDWKQVALAAVGGGLGGAMQGWAPLGETHTIANAALRSAISQRP
jgi:hypothetical protein